MKRTINRKSRRNRSRILSLKYYKTCSRTKIWRSSMARYGCSLFLCIAESHIWRLLTVHSTVLCLGPTESCDISLRRFNQKRKFIPRQTKYRSLSVRKRGSVSGILTSRGSLKFSHYMLSFKGREVFKSHRGFTQNKLLSISQVSSCKRDWHRSDVFAPIPLSTQLSSRRSMSLYLPLKLFLKQLL